MALLRPFIALLAAVVAVVNAGKSPLSSTRPNAAVRAAEFDGTAPAGVLAAWPSSPPSDGRGGRGDAAAPAERAAIDADRRRRPPPRPRCRRAAHKPSLSGADR